jgi:hypothetical protein
VQELRKRNKEDGVERMTDREKLIELICDYFSGCVTSDVKLADYLLDNGVTFATDTNDGGKWIPVTERLPKEQGFYLVAHQRSRCVAERFYYQDCPDLFVKTTGDPVTHWMPLPEPPKTKTFLTEE